MMHFCETHSMRVKILHEASRAWLPSLWPLGSVLLGNPSKFDIFHDVLQPERSLNHRVRILKSLLIVSTPPQRPTIHNHAILMKFSPRKAVESFFSGRTMHGIEFKSDDADNDGEAAARSCSHPYPLSAKRRHRQQFEHDSCFHAS